MVIDLHTLIREHGLHYGPLKEEVHRLFLRAYTRHLLILTAGNKSRAAKYGRMERSHFIKLVRRADEDSARPSSSRAADRQLSLFEETT